MCGIASQVKIHFIDHDDEGPGDGMVAVRVEHFVPRAGDEIRVESGAGKGKFFVITKVVWIYDGTDAHFSRVDIGVRAVK